jgi:hypothetical protein
MMLCDRFVRNIAPPHALRSRQRCFVQNAVQWTEPAGTLLVVRKPARRLIGITLCGSSNSTTCASFRFGHHAVACDWRCSSDRCSWLLSCQSGGCGTSGHAKRLANSAHSGER